MSRSSFCSILLPLAAALLDYECDLFLADVRALDALES